MTDALHLLAHSRGVVDGTGCTCIVCGASPFSPTDWPLGDNFSDWSDVAGTGDVVCAGCASVLRGRPGDQPPPLRTVHVLAVEGEPATYPGRADLDGILRSPPSRPFVFAVAESMQRHAALRAGVSSEIALLIGTDTATVTYRPAQHLPLLDAVAALCIPAAKSPGFTRDQIRTGNYSAPQILTFGAEKWEALERIVSAHRPSDLLDLLCFIARPVPISTEPANMIDPIDETAALLLADIARASPLDRKAVDFWGGFLLHRVTRFADQPLPSLVSRLMGACNVPPMAAAEIVSNLGAISQEDMEAVSAAFRSRAPLLVALAFERTRPPAKAAKAAKDPA